MKASDVMTANPITVTPDVTVREAVRILHDQDIRHLPITRSGELLGMVSDRDLRSFLPSEDDKILHPEQYRAHLAEPVHGIAQTDIIRVNPDTEVSDIIDIMVDQKIGAVPVVRETDDHLVGIISYIDILKAAQGAI